MATVLATTPVTRPGPPSWRAQYASASADLRLAGGAFGGRDGDQMEPFGRRQARPGYRVMFVRAAMRCVCGLCSPGLADIATTTGAGPVPAVSSSCLMSLRVDRKASGQMHFIDNIKPSCAMTASTGHSRWPTP